MVIVKGTKAHAETIREQCRTFLEGELKLTLNMEKTHITHVNDGFVFLGHRIIRKRGKTGRMSVVTTIPKAKAKAPHTNCPKALSSNHDLSKVDMVDRLNRQLAGWAAFYKFTDFTAKIFQRIDSRSVLEIRALAGAEISQSHQTAAAQMVQASRGGQSENLVPLRDQ